MTSININKEKFGQLIHKEKPVLYRDGKAIDSIVAPESKIMIENFINEALEK